MAVQATRYLTKEETAARMAQVRAWACEVGERFRPHQIILFGSYAYGRPTTDSDVDLLVVMETELKPWEQATSIRTSMPHMFPMDLLVRTPRELAQRIGWGDYFLREITSQGSVLYESAGS